MPTDPFAQFGRVVGANADVAPDREPAPRIGRTDLPVRELVTQPRQQRRDAGDAGHPASYRGCRRGLRGVIRSLRSPALPFLTVTTLPTSGVTSGYRVCSCLSFSFSLCLV